MGLAGDHGLHGDLRYWPVPELVALDLPGGMRVRRRPPGGLGHRRCRCTARPAIAPGRRRGLARRPAARLGWSVGRRAARAPGGMPVEDGDALVVATSGTSGQPKGVVLTHDAVGASARATSARLGIDPTRHTWLACLPLAHIGGLAVVTRRSSPVRR